jgi:hypothetical protein
MPLGPIRETQARETLARDGLFVTGKQGLRPHPATAIERDSKILFARLVSQLGLDDAEEPVTEGQRDARRSNRLGGWRSNHLKVVD